jgi:copper transport protein
LAFFLATGIAEAHAHVVSTQPPANATITSSPDDVSITYNEFVTIESPQAFVIMRPNGRIIACAGGTRVDPDNHARVICKPAVRLGRGAYTVFWLVTSKDTHVVHGAFSFGVNVKVREALGIRDYPYDPSGLLANALRWLSLLGAALVVGTLTFEAFVLANRAYPEEAQAARASLARSSVALRRAGICIAAVVSVLALDVQAAAATGTDALGALPSLPLVILESTWGLAWLARIFALAGIGLLTWRGNPSAVSLALCAPFLFSFSQSGHAVASNATLAMDWIHLACACLWFGGLATLGVGLRPALGLIDGPARPAFIGTLVSRFSTLALPAVIALVGTGVGASLAHFVTVSNLTKTPYASVILAKVSLLVPLLALGYYHLRFGRKSPPRVLTVTLACEAAIVVVVLGLSAVLTGLPPPNPPGHDHG